MNYREALEFIGEVQAGISWDRFCIHAVRHSDVFIDILNDTEESRKYLLSKGIAREYITGEITKILRRLHFNADNDHYITLALPGSASETQIHKRWKELMLLYHPDRNRDADAVSCSARINEAYSGIKSAEKRMEYDRKRVEAHRFRPEVRRFRTPSREAFVFGSPKMRSILSKLVIPFSVVIAGVVLLIIFIENREKSFVYQAAVAGREDGGQQVRPAVPVPQQSGVPRDAQEEKAAPKDANSSGPQAERFPQEKGQPPSLPGAKETSSRAARTEVPRKEQKTGAQPAPVPERKSRISPEWTVTASAGPRKAVAEEDREKRAVADDREVTGGRPADKPQETPPVKTEKPAPAQHAQGSSTAEPDKIKRSVDLFIAQYTRAYEQSDIEKFMALFSKEALENDRMNLDEIRSSYGQTFAKNRYRYNLRNVHFKKKGDDVIVTAFYVIEKAADSGGEALAEGHIRWILAEEGEFLKIRRVDYEGR